MTGCLREGFLEIMMKKKRSHKRKSAPQREKGLNYICPNCGAEEIISYEVLEDFDMMYPEEMLKGPHQFRCEKCEEGIMQPEEYEARVKGFGLYEGLDYTIKKGKKEKS